MKPLLAAKLESLDQLSFPILATPKLDGIRCLLWQGKAVTRKLKPVPNRHIRATLEARYQENLDGELMIPGLDFNGVQSAVMSEDGNPDFQYVVFDVIDQELPYRERVTLFPECLQPALIENEAALLDYERQCLSDGYEGVMLRSPDGRYKFGRSTVKEGILLKLKRFNDAEATVIGLTEKMHNSNEAGTDELGYTKRSSEKAGMMPTGMLGALLVVSNTGKEFAIGTGFDDAMRREIWSNHEQYMGRLVTYSFQELSYKGVPRFPVFKGFRLELGCCADLTQAFRLR